MTVHAVVDGKMTNEQLGEMTRRMDEIKRRVNEGTIAYDWAVDKLQGIVEGVTTVERGEESTILNPVSTGPLFLDPADGTEVIANARDVFMCIDSNFRNWGVDEPGQATGETPVRVHELVREATFQQMFASLSSDTRKLCLTQSQIIGFVKKHRQWLRTDGYVTFFLFQSHDQLFVAFVCFDTGGVLRVRVRRFWYPRVWDGECRRRVVVPQLA